MPNRPYDTVANYIIETIRATSYKLQFPPLTKAEQAWIKKLPHRERQVLAFTGDAALSPILTVLLQSWHKGRRSGYYVEAKKALVRNCVLTAMLITAGVVDVNTPLGNKKWADLFEVIVGVLLRRRDVSYTFSWVSKTFFPLAEAARFKFHDLEPTIIQGPIIFPTPSPLPKRRMLDQPDCPPPPSKRLARRHTTSPSHPRTRINLGDIVNFAITPLPPLLTYDKAHPVDGELRTATRRSRPGSRDNPFLLDSPMLGSALHPIDLTHCS